MKQILQNLRSKSWHVILGADLFLIGCGLTFYDGYFLFPPFMITIMNDDIVGYIGIATGIGLIIWAGRGEWNTKANKWLLVVACSFLACITSFEALHAFHFGLPHSLMAFVNDLSLLLYALNLTYRSKTKD